MGKTIRIILIVVCLAVFLGAGGMIAYTLYGYSAGARVYDNAVEEFVTVREPARESVPAQNPVESVEPVASTQPVSDSLVETESGEGIVPPISVDFERLKAINSDVVGWIYSENTCINYPVVQGDDNSYYLKHLIDGSYNKDGSIFVDIANSGDFSDINTIVYGHNMKDGEMFAEILKYEDQIYYEEHPVMWLLTPEQNYRIDLFSGYTTESDSGTYMLFDGYGAELEDYVASRKELSDFYADVAPEGEYRMVVLSTCAYDFDNARYVLHGVLTPAE